MKKLIALILISLLIPIPSASANDDVSSTFLKIVSGNDIELTPAYPKQNALDYRQGYTKVSLGVSVCRSGIPTWLIECAMNARKVSFSIVDNNGRMVILSDKDFYSYGHGLDIAMIKNINFEIVPYQTLVLPLKLKAEFEFVQTSPTTLQTFYYPLNVKLNKVDTAKADAEAKAEADRLAEAKAKADAEAKAKADLIAKADAELKAKQEAEAKAKAEAENPTWYCTLDTTKTLMTKSKADALCSQILANQKAFAQSEILKERNIAIIGTAKSMYENTRCTKLNSIKAYLDIYKFKCVKKGKVLVWKIQN
jgi:hypothetical protein